MRDERKVKLAKQIQREVNGVIHKDFHVPTGVILTITDVTISNDCRSCCVFYSVYVAPDTAIGAVPDADVRLKRETGRMSRMLTRKSKYFKYIIGKNMRIKNIPEVFFKLDQTPARAAKIDDILNQIASEGGESGEGVEGGS